MEKTPSARENVIKSVFNLMKSSNSEEEWEENEKTVKETFQGKLPDFWYHIFIIGGKKQEIIESFGSAKIIDLYTKETKDDLYKALEKLEDSNKLIFA